MNEVTSLEYVKLYNSQLGLLRYHDSSMSNLCLFHRGNANQYIFDEVQYAPWCATFSVLNEDNIGLEERSCLTTHFYACQQSIVPLFLCLQDKLYYLWTVVIQK